MKQDILTSFKVSLLTIFLTGLCYPYVVTELSTLLFYKQARGSLILNEKKQIVGSKLIGQIFKSPGYFFARPSFAGEGYNALFSGGSNEGPTSKKLQYRILKMSEELKVQNNEKIPIDLVTASASGLDPHITPEAAYWQAARIALVRDVALRRVHSIVNDNIEYAQFGFIGEPRINVLKLNIALDKFFGLQARVK